MKNNKIQLANFVTKDRFELNLYITYLFKQFNMFDPTELKAHKTEKSSGRILK